MKNTSPVTTRSTVSPQSPKRLSRAVMVILLVWRAPRAPGWFAPDFCRMRVIHANENPHEDIRLNAYMAKRNGLGAVPRLLQQPDKRLQLFLRQVRQQPAVQLVQRRVDRVD